MPRQPGIQYDGALYHVMARGDHREDIFLDDKDRITFLQTLADACGRTGWLCHAYVLMPNHYHLVIETPQPNLVAGMSWLQNAFTRRHNVRHGRWGHLFGGRYKAILVDDEDGWYLGTLIDYVHLNPARAGLVSLETGLEAFPWSSLPAAWLQTPAKRKAWMCVERGLRTHGLRDDAAGRRAYLSRLEEKVRRDGREAGGVMPDNLSLQSTLRRGWYFGAQGFREKALKVGEAVMKLASPRKNYGGSAELKDHHLHTAARLLQAGMMACKLTKEDLAALACGDERKALIALMIKERTTVPLDWIAKELLMGTRSTVSRRAAEVKKELQTNEKLSRLMKRMEKEARL
jgi:putative transposase